jgi:hypothetical protein
MRFVCLPAGRQRQAPYVQILIFCWIFDKVSHPRPLFFPLPWREREGVGGIYDEHYVER